MLGSVLSAATGEIQEHVELTIGDAENMEATGQGAQRRSRFAITNLADLSYN
jgi:hypothetical protein